MLDIKLALCVIRTSALGCVDGVLFGNMYVCKLGASYGVPLGSY